MNITHVAIWLLALLLLIPSTLFFTQVLSAYLHGGRRLGAAMGVARASGTDSPVVAILVPAHDEAAGLAPTLACFRASMRAHDRLVVVADNCCDDTAAIARAAGAEVVERFDTALRGKAYALEAGLDYLRAQPPGMVLVLDADCTIAPDFVATLAAQCRQHQAPIQSLYLMKAPEGDLRPVSLLAEFAWRIKNWVRPLGGGALGFPSNLNGSGMIFPWQQIAAVQVANGNLAEDYKLGIDLLRLGHATRFSEAAQVLSRFPNSLESRRGQRRRWEHGHLDLILRTAPGLAGEALSTGRWKLLGAALDLLIPPLALLAAIAALSVPLVILAALLHAPSLPLQLCVAAWLLLGFGLALAWVGWGRDLVPLRVLAAIPGYAIGKLSLYTGYVSGREREWKRTRRD